MALNINCQYCNEYLFCTHPTRSKFLWIFKRQCVIANGQLNIGERCQIQKEFPEPTIKTGMRIGVKRSRKKLNLAYPQKVCAKCYFYNENWEKEWDQKEHSWCNKKDIDMLHDKESEKLGYCKHFKHKESSIPQTNPRRFHVVEDVKIGRKPMPDTIPFTEKDVKQYLDSCIIKWRKFRDAQGTNREVKARTVCYIDAFQSVRTSLFGEILGKQGTNKSNARKK